MRGKLYLLLAIIAMSTITFAMIAAKVKAPMSGTYVDFYVDPPTISGADKDPVGEYIYNDLDVTLKVSLNDVRLTPVRKADMTYYDAGTIVGGSDEDVGKTLVAFKTTSPGREKHTENVMVDTWYNVGEYIYRDADNNNLVSEGDVRTKPPAPYTAGTKVAAGDPDIGPALIAFKATTGHYERHAENIIANTWYDYAKILVDIYVSSDLVYDDAGSMIGWQMNIKVDPAALTPTVDSIGMTTGYFLYDFCVDTVITNRPTLLSSVQPGGVLMLTEGIQPAPYTGAGNNTEETGHKLVTAVFAAQSSTAYSKIDMLFLDQLIGGDPFNPGTDGISDDWMTPEGTAGLWYPATEYDGDYNPGVPEFPLGIGVLMSVVALIPVIYTWRTRRKKKVE